MKGQVRFIAKDKSDFFRVLRNRVDAYFEENKISKNANAEMVLKTIILLTAYILPFIIILFQPLQLWAFYALWLVMGVAVAGIGMSVMHDANHGSYTSKSWLNDLIGYSLNLLGGSVFNWKLQHNVLHHTYTNVVPYDEDIKNRLVLKFNPHSPTKYYHKFQFIYAFFFYGILTLYWVFLKDLVQFISFIKDGVNTNTKKENVILFFKITLTKVVYIFSMLVMPVMFFGLPAGDVILGFVIMHFAAGLILTVIFQLAHTVDGTTHPLPNEKGTIENDWAIHQLNTTVNFSRNNAVLSWYLGGLNYQVEHHLFPRICHVHYPALAPIVKQTAEEYGIPYLENETFEQAMSAHLRLLRKLGTLPSINEAIS